MRQNSDKHDTPSFITNEFIELNKKAGKCFEKLRCLPHYGRKLWARDFITTFDAYNKLWKYQLKYRNTLQTEIGLSGQDIGGIASTIAQLYYNYYVRVCDCY